MEMRSRVTLPVVLRLCGHAAGDDEHVSLVEGDGFGAFGAGSQPLAGAGAAGILRGSAELVLCGAVDDLKDVVAVLVVLELFSALVGFDGEDGGEGCGL